MANNLLNDIKAHPDSWLLVDKILDNSKSPQSKFLALQILDEAVNVISYFQLFPFYRPDGKFYQSSKKLELGLI